MAFSRDRALQLLRIGTGNTEAEFREGQEEAIRHLVQKRGRLLVVQKTGWGKSFVYFIVTKLLREQGAGPALLISPLLALMRNQIDAATRMGVRAATINSENEEDWDAVEQSVQSDGADILLVSPERLANERFQAGVLNSIAPRVSMLVVDEAHCISDWGHDFRPQYRLLERIARTLPRNIRLLGTTATANQRVMDDLVDVLGPDLEIIRGDLNRPSLSLQTIRMPSQAERLAWLAEYIPRLPGSGIVYALTVRDANQVAEWLRSRGINVEAYTGESGDRRPQLEAALLNNAVKALVATTALGMGYDKPDLAFVIHYQTPGSVVAYYQQVGRAGRALDSAYGVILSGEEEQDINKWFIESAFPTRDEVAKVIESLENAQGGLSLPELESALNMRRGRIVKTLELMSLEAPAPVVKQRSRKWLLTAGDLSETFWERAARLTELRREENRQMQDYVNLPFGEHMRFLIAALDGDPTEASEPRLPPLSDKVSEPIIREAVEFLKRMNLEIEPRVRWPQGGMPHYGLTGVIPEELRMEPGRALCVWGDAGWGGQVRRGKCSDGRFSDELVSAVHGMLTEWDPQPVPEWVTCIPSLRHPTLVPDFARRLAKVLKLPFHQVLARTEDRPEQKTMQNSVQQARNVDGSLRVVEGRPRGPVIVVDDLVDSRWTMTVAAWLLRSHGFEKVFPVALAQAGGRNDV